MSQNASPIAMLNASLASPDTDTITDHHNVHWIPSVKCGANIPIIVEDRHLTEEAKRRTLWDNAADLFHIGAGLRS